MALTEFYCQSGGNNVNAGSTTNNTAAYTSTSGNWSTVTNQFTPVDGSTPASTVSVGDFASVYIDGATTAVYIGRVTVVAAGVNGPITVSNTIKAGTAPTTASGTRSIKVGGAWLGGSAGATFPFSLAGGFGACLNIAGDRPRINLKNDQTYTYTTSQTFVNQTGVTVQGYTGSPGDGGKATLTNSTVAATGFTIAGGVFADLIFVNTGGSSTQSLVSFATNQTSFYRVVNHGARGTGFSGGTTPSSFTEVEVYDFNKSNTSGKSGIDVIADAKLQNCIIRDASGGNCTGLRIGGSGVGSASVQNSIFADLGGSAIVALSSSSGPINIVNNDFYNCTGDALNLTSDVAGAFHVIRNNNFIKNGGKAINANTGLGGFVDNNGYGAGTQANGGSDVLGSLIDSGTAVTYASNVTPWVDPTTGDFRINDTAANWAGRSVFTQTDANYGTNTIGYPDIGAAQSKTGGGGTFGKETSHGVAQ